jgi:hypothetical protein
VRFVIWLITLATVKEDLPWRHVLIFTAR